MVEPVHSVLLFPFPSPVPNSVSVESSDEALPNRIAAKLERDVGIVSVSMSRARFQLHAFLALDNFAFH